MKFKNSDIKAKIHKLNGCEYLVVHPCLDRYFPEADAFFKTYSELILEWSKGLYSPFLFLQDIIRKLNGFSNEQSVILEYSGEPVLNASSINWKYYKLFREDLEKHRSIKFFIVYWVSHLNELIEKMADVGISDGECGEFRKSIKTKKAFCILNDLSYGRCIICINGNKISKSNHDEIETSLDHELNHYFRRYSADSNDIESLTLTEKIEKIAEDIGYDLRNSFQRSDFISHILDEDEFVPMVSNVCNILTFKLRADRKFEWFVDHSTTAFILSDEYKTLCSDLQNILLFSTICRIYSSKRWNFLKEKVKQQLDCKEGFVHSLKSGILTFIERIRNR